MKVLVTGGAGYIGSHATLALLQRGDEVHVIDNLCNASAESLTRVERLGDGTVPFHEVDLRDREAVEKVLAHGFDAVIHFAGLKAVGESVEIPLDYYGNNIEGTLVLLRAMRATGCRTIVFSSSATVYGDRAPVPYVEDYEPLDATNPYGRTKVMLEKILVDLAAAEPDWKVGLLRYFNPVGAHPSGDIGEDPLGIPNNLTPYIAQVAVGRRERLTVFGDDYDTPDGTCLRDYIHVTDLVDGHTAALDWLAAHDPGSRAWNLGTGQGTSVLEVISAFERASGREIPYVIGPRRAGDLPATYADATRARDELGWVAAKDIDDMCVDLWRWQSQNPQGFSG